MPDQDQNEPKGEIALTPITGMDAVTRSEINLQVEFAMQHPRNITHTLKELETLVTLNQDVAEESFYTLKREDKYGKVKLIQGPSIRFAEVLAYCWGNNRWQKRIADVDQEFVTGEGVFMDLQRNIMGKVQTKRRITDKNGRRYNADMIQTTGNASASLAYRNAVTGTIPQAIWKHIFEKAKETAVGGTQSVAEKRLAAIEYGKKIGVSEEQIYNALGVQGINDLNLEELISLKGLYNSLKDGEMTIEDAFGDPFEKEITALYEQLGYNVARRNSLREGYRGKSVDLLAYLRKQAEGVTGEQKPVEAEKAEAKTEEKPELAYKKRGRPAKQEAAPEEKKTEQTPNIPQQEPTQKTASFEF